MQECKTLRRKAFLCFAMVSACMFIAFACIKTAKESISYERYLDTTLSVYGPYNVVKLPIAGGVKIANPIQISLGPEGLIYVSNQTGEVYSLRDTNGDGVEDMALLYCNVKDYALRSPAGFANRGDTIYIGTAQEIRAFLDNDRDGKADTSWTFFSDIPNSEHPYEWTCALNFSPDGWLYCAMSTDSWNAAPSPDPKGYRGSIVRISPDGRTVERIATGIRSVYGMAFNPNGDIYFTDNEGGGNAKEELNLLLENGFYGHNPAKYEFDEIVAPLYSLETETAPSGIEFNPSGNDFGGTEGNLFVAFYGPGERWTRGGISRVQINSQADGRRHFEEFPVADIPKLSDLAFAKDGALYLAQHGEADYWYNAVFENQGAIYKMVYDPESLNKAKTRSVLTMSLSENSVEAGKQLYAEHACLACHAVDGETELLGPNLKDVGQRLTREDILEEIMDPSKRIKPSMGAVKVFKRDGKILIGRVVNSDEEKISLMMVGNHIVDVPRSEIEKTENERKSLMYEGLLSSMTEGEKQSLLDYLFSLSR